MEKKKINRFERVMYALLAAPIRFFMRIRCIGRENIPAEGGYVLVSNHISFCDPVVISAAFPAHRLPRYLAKAELFRIPVLSTLIRALGAVPLDRSGKDMGAVRRAVSIAESGEILSLFPQGTRRKGVNPADTPLKSGAGMIAARAGVPILPVCIRLKNVRYAFLRRVDVVVGKPLSQEELGLLAEKPDYKSATEIAFRAVCDLGGYQPTALTEPKV